MEDETGVGGCDKVCSRCFVAVLLTSFSHNPLGVVFCGSHDQSRTAPNVDLSIFEIDEKQTIASVRGGW
jgi:hypothetical protein